MRINISDKAQRIIGALRDSGYSAYIVGGCVRDSLLGKEPKDWDICTSALPQQAKAALQPMADTIIETGLKHGTITALVDGEGFEVTTFRTDGKYTDGRHPDAVEFVSDLKEDLARRDFTINAMAYSEEEGLIDYFGGEANLHAGRIVCVGDPDKRFDEDALRILRAMRFASTYGFCIAPETRDAIFRNRDRLDLISAERKREELVKIVCGKYAFPILSEYQEVITKNVVPQLDPCVGMQQNRWHLWDVYGHMIHAVDNSTVRNPVVQMALLLHDIGKPNTMVETDTGRHFYHHPDESEKIADTVLKNLRFSNVERLNILTLIKFHDTTINETEKSVKKWLGLLGEEQLRNLIAVKCADIMAHNMRMSELQDLLKKYTERVPAMLEKVLADEACFSLKDLAINGHDLMDAGVEQGKEIGVLLHKGLDAVIDGLIENEKDTLLQYLFQRDKEN